MIGRRSGSLPRSAILRAMPRKTIHRFWRSPSLPFVEGRCANDSAACYAPHSHSSLSIGAVNEGCSVFSREGMRQRLGIAQAIMEDPALLILDEPMNGLDNQGVSDMRKLFLELKARGKTILLASHNKDDIEALCDHVYEMDAGRLKQLR